MGYLLGWDVSAYEGRPPPGRTFAPDECVEQGTQAGGEEQRHAGEVCERMRGGGSPPPQLLLLLLQNAAAASAVQ